MAMLPPQKIGRQSILTGRHPVQPSSRAEGDRREFSRCLPWVICGAPLTNGGDVGVSQPARQTHHPEKQRLSDSTITQLTHSITAGCGVVQSRRRTEAADG